MDPTQLRCHGGFAEAHDRQGGEHIACAAEEAVDGWDVDFETAGGSIAAGGGADDGNGGGGGVEADGCDDEVGDVVGLVEFGYGLS